jgi:Protein of unknown function (DUF5656)
VDPARPAIEPRKLSTLAALVLLAYCLVRVVPLPTTSVTPSLFGISVRLDLSATALLLLLAASLAVAGTDWIIRSHPRAPELHPSFEHWIIPGLAALALGGIVIRLPHGAWFWFGLALSAVLLVAVVQAEFIALDREDPRFDGAAISLRALAWLLLLGALFSIRISAPRAILSVPLVLASVTFVTWRLLRLDERASPAWVDAALVGLATSQVDWGLHYWPITPLRQALLIALMAYVLVSLILAFRQGRLGRERLIEVGVVSAIALLAILLLS